jgi:hypothetical protein
MTDRIRVGTMLVADNTPMPATLAVSTECYAAGWSSTIGSTSAQLDKVIENAGWTHSSTWLARFALVVSGSTTTLRQVVLWHT